MVFWHFEVPCLLPKIAKLKLSWRSHFSLISVIFYAFFTFCKAYLVPILASVKWSSTGDLYYVIMQKCTGNGNKNQFNLQSLCMAKIHYSIGFHKCQVVCNVITAKDTHSILIKGLWSKFLNEVFSLWLTWHPHGCVTGLKLLNWFDLRSLSYSGQIFCLLHWLTSFQYYFIFKKISFISFCVLNMEWIPSLRILF